MSDSAGRVSSPLYGLRGPRWYVTWRGLRWAKRGYCPCCYSSPPREVCWVCSGSYNYGPTSPKPLREERARRWKERPHG